MKLGMSEGALIAARPDIILRYPEISDIRWVIHNKASLDKENAVKLSRLPKLDLPQCFPSKIICLAKNYAAHAKEMGVKPTDLPKQPSVFLKPPSALVGPGKNIVIPPQTQDVHHEVELAVIIGKRVKNVSVEEAMESVFGYSILLDITARDLQSEAKQSGRPWFVSKGFDTFAPMGPYIVTTDDVQDPHNLNIELKVNGEIKQSGNTRDMIFEIDRIVSYCSTITTLEPGDIIATGTPEGVGEFQRGDIIEATISSLGELRVGVI
jgi:2-keto-4-pentenoate hydratase/2-oxohepta-3-ene-1,7-dioic acid hydratase in catechol pathway